ncbi:MAG: SelB C-terminal domain-containing protein, partial [Candidatus Limnocylindrales bacterium]
RGAVLTSDPDVSASPGLVGLLRAPGGSSSPGGRWPPRPGAAFRLHLGTDQVEAVIGRGRRDWLVLPNGRLVARLRLARPIALADGDPFVLRPGQAGAAPIGGTILDRQPPMGPARRRAEPAAWAALASADRATRERALLMIHGVLPRERGRTLANSPSGPRLLADRWVDQAIATALEAEAEALVGATAEGSGQPGRPTADVRASLVRTLRRTATTDPNRAGAIVDAILSELEAAGRLLQDAGRLREPGGTIGPSPDVARAMDRLERILSVVAPPALSEAIGQSGCPADGVRALEAGSRIVRIDDDLAYAAETYGKLARTALSLATSTPLSPAALRDATGTSRKYVMAILEDLDRRGILRRTPAGHLPGPRAALAATLGRAPR